MLNLGYLDIFASEIKKDESGEAFLPGECFWDPLKMLDGAPDEMKRVSASLLILFGVAMAWDRQISTTTFPFTLFVTDSSAMLCVSVISLSSFFAILNLFSN